MIEILDAKLSILKHQALCLRDKAKNFDHKSCDRIWFARVVEKEIQIIADIRQIFLDYEFSDAFEMLSRKRDIIDANKNQIISDIVSDHCEDATYLKAYTKVGVFIDSMIDKLHEGCYE